MATMVLKPSGSEHSRQAWGVGNPRQRSALTQRVNGRIDRPKSTPASIRRSTSTTSDLSARPHTSMGMQSCDRVYQVEREPTRKHNLESHLPVKRNRPPPWQKSLDKVPKGAVNTTVTAPGYILSRSKSKMYMYIKTEDFFTDDPGAKNAKKPDPERDGLIAQLQEQIDDLNLFLEEERLNHKETKKKAADDLQAKIDEMNQQQEEVVTQLQEDYEEEMEKLRLQHGKELNDHINITEQNTAKLRGEVEFLHGAFESYKSQLHADTDEKWRRHEKEILEQHEQDLQKQIQEIRNRVVAEKTMERTELGKQHQRDLHALKREHKREVDALIRKFADAAETVTKLKDTEARLASVEKEYDNLKSEYDDVCSRLAETTQELTDTKVELMGYEKNFQDKVLEIENRYHNQIHNLMAQNTELRRLYMKKCGQLFEEKAGVEEARRDTIQTTKQAMRYDYMLAYARLLTQRLIIETRRRAEVNLAAGDPLLEVEEKEPKQRPLSAPVTHQESHHALVTAGETDQYVEKQSISRPSTCRPRTRDSSSGEDSGDDY